MLTQDIVKQFPHVQIVSTVAQDVDEAEWLAVRTKGLGGSDVGAICGVSPFSSARQIYFNKTGQFEEALKPGAAAQERMHFGHLLEPIVADEFAKRELIADKGRDGWSLCELGATVCLKDAPWMRANVDRLIKNKDGKVVGILECKTTSEYNNEEWEQGDILMSYIYQLNWYLYILDLQWGAFACLVGGNKFYTYEVYRNDELLNETIIPKAKDFWFNNVLALKEPELQAVDTVFANDKYSEVEKNSEVVLDDEESDNLAAVIFECKAKIKELEKTLEEAQNRLKDRLKDKEIGYCRNYTVKWSPRSQTRVDTTLLKTTFPEVYEQCKKVTSFRVMQVKGLPDA
jgi:putative phage-type endonuclease